MIELNYVEKNAVSGGNNSTAGNMAAQSGPLEFYAKIFECEGVINPDGSNLLCYQGRPAYCYGPKTNPSTLSVIGSYLKYSFELLTSLRVLGVILFSTALGVGGGLLWLIAEKVVVEPGV